MKGDVGTVQQGISSVINVLDKQVIGENITVLESSLKDKSEYTPIVNVTGSGVLHLFGFSNVTAPASFVEIWIDGVLIGRFKCTYSNSQYPAGAIGCGKSIIAVNHTTNIDKINTEFGDIKRYDAGSEPLVNHKVDSEGTYKFVISSNPIPFSESFEVRYKTSGSNSTKILVAYELSE